MPLGPTYPPRVGALRPYYLPIIFHPQRPPSARRPDPARPPGPFLHARPPRRRDPPRGRAWALPRRRLTRRARAGRTQAPRPHPPAPALATAASPPPDSAGPASELPWPLPSGHLCSPTPGTYATPKASAAFLPSPSRPEEARGGRGGAGEGRPRRAALLRVRRAPATCRAPQRPLSPPPAGRKSGPPGRPQWRDLPSCQGRSADGSNIDKHY